MYEKFEHLHEKVFEIFGKLRISWKDAFSTDKARFHRKCLVVVRSGPIRLVSIC